MARPPVRCLLSLPGFGVLYKLREGIPIRASNYDGSSKSCQRGYRRYQRLTAVKVQGLGVTVKGFRGLLWLDFYGFGQLPHINRGFLEKSSS